MNPKAPQATARGKRVACITTAALLAATAVLLALYYLSEYLPLLLMALTVLVPTAIFAVLLLPHPDECQAVLAPDGSEAQAAKPSWRARLRAKHLLRRLLARHAVAVRVALILVLLVAGSIAFWWCFSTTESYYSFGN